MQNLREEEGVYSLRRLKAQGGVIKKHKGEEEEELGINGYARCI